MDMRTAIRIVAEGVEGTRLGRMVAAAREAASEHEIFQPHMDANDITPDAVRQYVARHADLFSGGPVTVYRVMELDEDQVEDLAPGDHLGNHWTTDPDGDLGLHVNDHDRLYLITATVTRDAVNLPLTVAHNCLYPHEQEVYVTGAVTFQSIEKYGYGSTDGENLRPDLEGETFYGNWQG